MVLLIQTKQMDNIADNLSSLILPYSCHTVGTAVGYVSKICARVVFVCVRVWCCVKNSCAYELNQRCIVVSFSSDVAIVESSNLLCFNISTRIRNLKMYCAF